MTVDTVPVVLHEGFSDDEIVGLADQDNENDEYHAVVPIVDVWMEYRRLYELWGNQQRVADAKGVTRTLVTWRLSFADLPCAVLEKFVTNDFLREGHAREISQLSQCDNLSPWLTRDAAMLEVLQSVIAKYGKSVTAKHIAEMVAVANEMIAYAASVADGWGEVTFYDGDTSYPDDEIVGLADRDNENDEYHASVPIVDVWQEYKRLADMGWKQERIADAKGVTQSVVADRIKYAKLSAPVFRAFIENEFLKEGHAREICRLSDFDNMSPAMLEVLQSVIAKHGKSVTAKHIAEMVAVANEMIAYAASVADGMSRRMVAARGHGVGSRAD